jgi:chorismate--pyruvate lyase
LGQFLFNNADIVRGELQITQAHNIWGRRSTFTIGNTQLLVSEFFLNKLYA